MGNHLLFVIGYERPSALLRALFLRGAGLTSWQAGAGGAHLSIGGAKMELNILGTIYQAEFKDYKDDPYFESAHCDGYCNNIGKKIVICCANTMPDQNMTMEESELYEKLVMRHEILHAFLYESGLDASSLCPGDGGWAKNEEMIDWFAAQFPKILSVYQAAGCL